MRGHSLLVSAIICIAALTTCDAKRVVLQPFPTTSYIIYHANIASALVRMGHEVWISVPHYLLEKNLIKDKAVKVLVYGESLGDVTNKLSESSKVVDNFWEGKDSEVILFFRSVFQVTSDFHKMCVEILSDDHFGEKLRNVKANLYVLDSTPLYLNLLVLPYKYDIPYALIGTYHNVMLARVPFSPAAFPFALEAVSDRMSFSQRLKMALISFINMAFEPFYDSNLVREFAPNKPYISITDLAARSEIFIAELDHILDYPRPALPNTKLTGGSSASPAKNLTGDFKKFVEEAKTGVIVASFGGSVISVPTNISDKIFAAFKQLDLRVVWRVNISSTEPNHIMTSKWIPQNDLLGHEKTKLFVSHCGKNGQYEALYHGVPILCLPIYGDQFYNAERIRVKQFGLTADMRVVTADELAGLMKEILYEKKYTENIKKASRLFRELYKVPMNEVAFWLDHVMTYGGDYMRSASQQMPLYQFLLLDVIAFIIGVIIFILVIIYLLIKLCCRCCKRQNIVSSKFKKE